MATWWMGAGLVLLLAAAALVVVAARASRSGGGDAAIVRTTLVIAAATAVIAAVGGVVAVLTALVQPQVEIAVPVREFWPTLPADTEIEGTTATRVAGGFTVATIQAEGLSLGARVCWAVAQGLAWLVPGAVAALVAVACSRLRAGRPFAPVLARMALVVAVVVALGGTASQVLGDIAGSIASHELLQWTGMVSSAEDAADRLPTPTLAVTFPFWPIGAGFGLAALATLLRRGQALQRDAEGLV